MFCVPSDSVGDEGDSDSDSDGDASTDFAATDDPHKAAHERVRHWTKEVDLFGKKLVLVPIHIAGHWWVPCV
jgi:predicted secreted acid phosphatase